VEIIVGFRLGTTYPFIFRFDVGNVMFLKVFDTIRDPSYSVLNAAWKVSVRLMWTQGHEHVREMLVCDTQKCPGTVLPLITQCGTVDTTKIDGFEGAGNYPFCQPDRMRYNTMSYVDSLAEKPVAYTIISRSNFS
jgi:hypothetical protein